MVAPTAAVRGKRSDGNVAVPVDDATLIEAGNLLFLDTDDAKLASSQADQLTLAANQRLFASLFLGAAAGGKQAADTWVDQVLVSYDPLMEREYISASEVHEIGDLLGIDEADSGTALHNTRMIKVTDEALAIARCVRQDTSASTTVRCRFIKSVVMGAPEAKTLKLQNAIASSTAVTASAVATTFSNGTKTVDGGALKAGDVLEIEAAGIVTTSTGSETVTVDLLVGTEVVMTTGAVDTTSADCFRLTAAVVIRVAGASGKLLSSGTWAIGAPASATVRPYCSAELSEDVSSSALTVTCRVTNSSTGESVLLHQFIVKHVRI